MWICANKKTKSRLLDNAPKCTASGPLPLHAEAHRARGLLLRCGGGHHLMHECKHELPHTLNHQTQLLITTMLPLPQWGHANHGPGGGEPMATQIPSPRLGTPKGLDSPRLDNPQMSGLPRDTHHPGAASGTKAVLRPCGQAGRLVTCVLVVLHEAARAVKIPEAVAVQALLRDALREVGGLRGCPRVCREVCVQRRRRLRAGGRAPVIVRHLLARTRCPVSLATSRCFHFNLRGCEE